MARIVLDAGHSLNTPGKRTPTGEHEWTFNDAVVRYAMKKLYEYQNVTLLRTDDPSGKVDVPLSTRAKRANDFKAEVFVSVHHNALGSVWGDHEGVETFVHEPIANNPKSKKLADCVHPHIVKAMQTMDRGIKSANFAVLRETNMPAILTEGGFMDSRNDIKKMRNDKFLKAQGEAIAKGIVEYCGLIPKPLPKPIISEVKGVSNEIILTPGQQKSKDVLVKHGMMAADYEVKDSTILTLITMLAPLVSKLEANGALE